uniref:MmcQ/YjbR family DNA-binding protein n=1 Tax=Solibacter usitatus (strain Ellin6076) TaxID=234267 RepID=Q020Z2_SOLUE
MTGTDYQRLALSLPGATVGSHMGNADFRVGGRIFATLSLESQGYGVLLLSPEQQAGMVEDAPEIFSPVPGGWGKNGSTQVLLAKVTGDILESALRAAWQRRVEMNAPKKKAKAKMSR